MKSLKTSSILAATVLILVSPAVALFVDVQLIGGVDIAAYSTWAWGEGTPMPNQEVERSVRATIEKEMSAKGYVRVDGEADCEVAIEVKKDEWFDGGFFKIEISDGKTREVVWRGKAEGAVNVQGTAKRQKLAQRTVKKMFKHLPAARVGD